MARRETETKSNLKYTTNTMSRRIPLTRGKFAIVDEDDFERVNRFKWTFMAGGYAYRLINQGTPQRRCIYMHRTINKTPKGRHTDHINGNGLDNRKINLRDCTPGQNLCNSRLRKTSTTGFKGVSFFPQTKKWRAYISRDGKFVHLGYFKTPEAAHAAYVAAAKKEYGEFFRAS